MFKPAIISIDNYKEVVQSKIFIEMELFSNSFLIKNQSILKEYSKKWVSDPFHQWSRQYEYPFVYYHIHDYVDKQEGKKIGILDAASGITFFPYYLSNLFKNIYVDCVDYDRGLKRLFEQVNFNEGQQVNFTTADIHALTYQNASYDIIYCISALEHTNDFEKVLREFKRVLKKDGLLIVTFDISLDGASDISKNKAKKLYQFLSNNFDCLDSINLSEFSNQLE